MTSFITKAALAPVAASLTLALMMASSAPASAQGVLTNGPEGMQPNTLGGSKPHSTRMHRPVLARRPLTVRRAGAPVVAAAPVAAPAVGANPITGALGVGGAVVGLPFQVLGGIFPADTAVRKGGVTNVRYVGAGAKQADIDEGWTMPVPVDRSGPIYVVANGDPTISPLTFVGTPIRAFGTVAQTPFRVLGAPFGGTPTF